MGFWGLNPKRECRDLIKKPWAYNPENSRVHMRNPNKGPRFLNQVPTLWGFGVSALSLDSEPLCGRGLGFRVLGTSASKIEWGLLYS